MITVYTMGDCERLTGMGVSVIGVEILSLGYDVGDIWVQKLVVGLNVVYLLMVLSVRITVRSRQIYYETLALMPILADEGSELLLVYILQVLHAFTIVDCWRYDT